MAFPLAAQDIGFDPDITRAEFREFSSFVSQAIYATPVEPARSRGLASFDIGVMATAIPIDEEALYWTRAVDSDFSTQGHLLVPRIVVSKGVSVANVSASYAQVPDSDIAVYGGSIDFPLYNGGLVRPTLGVRGSYAQIAGVDELDLKTYGAEVFLSKGFGPLTPYVGAGISRTSSRATIPATASTPEIRLIDEWDKNRITAGLRLSLYLPKIVIEATQGEELTYAAKISIGL